MLNQKCLDDLKDIDPDNWKELIVKLVDMYKQNAPAKFKNITDALASNNLKLMSNEAHSLKSSSATLGALQVSELCRKLEYLGKEPTGNTVNDAIRLVDALKKELDQALMELEQIKKA